MSEEALREELETVKTNFLKHKTETQAFLDSIGGNNFNKSDWLRINEEHKLLTEALAEATDKLAEKAVQFDEIKKTLGDLASAVTTEQKNSEVRAKQEADLKEALAAANERIVLLEKTIADLAAQGSKEGE